MKKILLSLIVLVILLPIIAVVAITQLVNPNDLKPVISQKANEATGGTLVINGDLGWRFFPAIGIDINDLVFTPPQHTQALASLKQAQLNLALLPLLSGKVSVGGIVINGANLHLSTNKQGVNNWGFLQQKQSNTNTVTTTPEEKNSPSGELSFNAQKIALTNITLNYNNQQENSQISFGPLNIESSKVNLHNNAFPLHIDFKTAINDDELNVTFKSDLVLSLEQTRNIAIQESDTSITVQGDATNGKKVKLTLLANGFFKEHTQAELTIEKLQLANLQASGSLNAKHLDDKPIFNGKVKVDTFNLKELLTNLGQEAPKTSNPKALTAINFNGKIEGPANSLIFNQATLNLDDTTFNGKLGLTNLDTQAFVLNLKGNSINLDGIMPPTEKSTDTQTPSQTNNTATTNTDTDLPIEALEGLNFTSQIQLQELIANGLTIHAVTLNSSGKNKVLSINDASAKLYNGSLKAQAKLDMRKPRPTLNINKELKGVELKPLLTDMSDTEWIAGNANAKIKLNAKGRTVNQIKSTLSGPVSFSINNLIAQEINLERNVCQAVAYARKQKLEGKWESQTRFKSVKGSLQFNNGIATSKSLSGGLNNLNMKGDAIINIPQEKFDAAMRMRIVGNLSEEKTACSVNSRYRSVDWPLRCKGSFSDDPSEMCGFDNSAMGDVIKQLTKAEASHAIDKKLKEEFGEGLDTLKGLFGR